LAICDPPQFTTVTPTTTQRTTEMGCCAGTEQKNTEMCNEKVGREQCERSGKCEFRLLETDCSWPTTTSEPWLGAKAQSGKGSKRAGARQENVLFGGEFQETMSTQVSLSTVLLCVAAAFAMYQVYRWYSNSVAQKKKTTASVRPNYQSV
jgi:hypothetical protein